MKLYKIISELGHYEYFVIASNREEALIKYEKRRQELGYLNSPDIYQITVLCRRNENIII